MNLTEAICARRAVRSYTSRPVEAATVTTLLAMAVQAPSAMNAQPWAFAIVQDPKQLRRYSDRAKAMLLERLGSDPKMGLYEARLRSEAFNIFYDAGTLVVICARERGSFTDADCWLAAENLMLAACGAGLGTCPIGFAIPVLNTPEIKEELKIPTKGAAVAPIIVGYPSGTTAPVSRAEPRVLTWIQ